MQTLIKRHKTRIKRSEPVEIRNTFRIKFSDGSELFRTSKRTIPEIQSFWKIGRLFSSTKNNGLFARVESLTIVDSKILKVVEL